MKKVIAILVSLIMAIGIAIGLPYLINQTKIDANISNSKSLVPQEIISYNTQEKTYNKLYAKGKLVGVINDIEYLNSLIDKEYTDYEEEFPNTTLGLSEDVFIMKERSFANFENVDDKIMNYLVENDLLGIKTTSVEFSTSEGVYEIIYVKDIDDFYEARDEFLLNFVSQETLTKLRNKEKISSPTSLGTVEKNLTMLESISLSEAVVSPDNILKNKKDIYDFFCYGRNDEREYYTVMEGDSISRFYNYFELTSKQVVSINKDVLKSEDQVITPGMKLNVTYFTSPITVEVKKEILQQQYIAPETPEYIEDDTKEAGYVEVVVQEEMGIQNILYEETWTNGKITDGKELSEPVIIKQPIRGQIVVGTKIVNLVGTGNYVWPIDNPYITTDFGGYDGHTGTDFINKYDSYCPVYAVDSGIVDEIGYRSDMGNYVMINHQNGIRTFYMHLNVAPFVDVGDNVERGQIIGQEGNTGKSYGAHLHLTFEVNGVRVNACNYLPCSLIR